MAFIENYQPGVKAFGLKTRKDAYLGGNVEVAGNLSADSSGADAFLRAERNIDPNKYRGSLGQRCIIPTPDPSSADGEVIHPSVLYIPQKWNGWHYWMAYTPYASSNDAYEDPCIAVSQDGVNWEFPAGLTNPLDNGPGGTKYNSDTHLVFGPDGLMYCFWRYLDTSGDSPSKEETLYVRTTSDGVTWTPKQIAYQSDRTVRRLLSPSFEYYDGLWHLWAVDIVGTKRIVYATAEEAIGPWTTPVDCTAVLPEGRYHWHLFVSRVGEQWVALINDTDNSGSSGTHVGDIILATSEDGIDWNVADGPCVPRSGTNYSRQYRSCFVPKVVDGMWGLDLWHSVRFPNQIYRSSLTSVTSTYAVDSGYVSIPTISAGASGSFPVTFAPGLFTDVPVVTATPTNGRLNVAIDQATVTKDGVTINAFNWTASNASGPSMRIYWQASQQ